MIRLALCAFAVLALPAFGAASTSASAKTIASGAVKHTNTLPRNAASGVAKGKRKSYDMTFPHRYDKSSPVLF